LGKRRFGSRSGRRVATISEVSDYGRDGCSGLGGNESACDFTVNPDQCEISHAGDEEYAAQIWYWSTPIEDCLDGRTDVKCTDYSDWTTAWQEIKG